MVNRFPGSWDPWESQGDWYRHGRMPWDSTDNWEDRWGPGPGGGPGGGRPPVPGGPVTPRAVDPGAIRGCLYRVTRVRLDRGSSFWFYPTFVGRESVAGYRWRSRSGRWEYFGIDLDRIRSFSCR
ncbi:hypothetical protein ABID49_002305 [Bhargavaea ullalensis]|uniref:Transporter n=1 Tax=Bhargavaea ullalensis TaxID=1265685 RepID=A0ABV2GDM3_9BACL